MHRKLIPSLVIAATAASGVFVASSPASAGTGGGCLGTAVASCISLDRGKTLVADLYQNSAPDSSRCTAYIEIRQSNGTNTWGGPYDIRSNGRRGPVRKDIITLPPTQGSAINRVHVYTCAGNLHHTVDSKRQYYP
jgi:hypothetical protein